MLRFCLMLLALASPEILQGQAMSSKWSVGIGLGASRGTMYCNQGAASWSCGTRHQALLGNADVSIGRAVRSNWIIGLEASPFQQRVRLDPSNTSKLSSLSLGLFSRIHPVERGPLYVQLAVAGSWFRLSERNNGSLYTESGAGWKLSASLGGAWRIAGRLHGGPFVRFDHQVLGPAEVFFERLRRRNVTVGWSLALH